MTAHHHHHLPHDGKLGANGASPIITATGKAAPPPAPPASKVDGGEDNSSKKRRRRRRPMIGPVVWAAFKEEQRVGRSQSGRGCQLLMVTLHGARVSSSAWSLSDMLLLWQLCFPVSSHPGGG